MVRGCRFSERGMGIWKISSLSISGASKIDRHMCLCVIPLPPPHLSLLLAFKLHFTYLTTSPFSNATLPRRTNAVTSVRLPTPRFAKSLSNRNISTFCFGCLVAPETCPFFDEGVFFSSFASFSLAARPLLLLLPPPVLRVRRPCDGWWPWRVGWWKMKEEEHGTRKRADLNAAGDLLAVAAPIDASACKEGLEERGGGRKGEVSGERRVGRSVGRGVGKIARAGAALGQS